MPEGLQFSPDEVIKRLMRLEEKVLTVEDGLSDTNDLQLINKLDVINLKNEIDRLKMGLSGPGTAPRLMPPEPKIITKTVEKIVRVPVEKIIEKRVPVEKIVRVTQKPKNMCADCGAWVPPQAKFCSKCGARRNI